MEFVTILSQIFRKMAVLSVPCWLLLLCTGIRIVAEENDCEPGWEGIFCDKVIFYAVNDNSANRISLPE